MGGVFTSRTSAHATKAILFLHSREPAVKQLPTHRYSEPTPNITYPKLKGAFSKKAALWQNQRWLYLQASSLTSEHRHENNKERSSSPRDVRSRYQEPLLSSFACLFIHTLPSSRKHLRGQLRKYTRCLFIKILPGSAWWNNNNPRHLISKTWHTKIKINTQQVQSLRS